MKWEENILIFSTHSIIYSYWGIIISQNNSKFTATTAKNFSNERRFTSRLIHEAFMSSFHVGCGFQEILSLERMFCGKSMDATNRTHNLVVSASEFDAVGSGYLPGEEREEGRVLRQSFVYVLPYLSGTRRSRFPRKRRRLTPNVRRFARLFQSWFYDKSLCTAGVNYAR